MVTVDIYMLDSPLLRAVMPVALVAFLVFSLSGVIAFLIRVVAGLLGFLFPD